MGTILASIRMDYLLVGSTSRISLILANYSYFGTSNGWTDGGWVWHEQYDRKYGNPLGPATKNASGWSREFSGCSVFLSGSLKASTISMKH